MTGLDFKQFFFSFEVLKCPNNGIKKSFALFWVCSQLLISAGQASIDLQLIILYKKIYIHDCCLRRHVYVVLPAKYFLNQFLFL